MIKTCLECSREFERPSINNKKWAISNKRWLNRKFCSRKCQGKSLSENFLGKNHHSWKGGLENIQCIECKIMFKAAPCLKQKFCSKKCLGKARSGENNNKWKGGITPLNEKIRSCSKYKLWRTMIYVRDNYTCIKCHQRGGKLRADHIKPFSFIVAENDIKSIENAIRCEELWNQDNGRTLCLSCDKQFGWNLFKENNPNKNRSYLTNQG